MPETPFTPEQLRAVSDGRARVSRRGYVVSSAPGAHVPPQYAAGTFLPENPNRGKRHGARLANPDGAIEPLDGRGFTPHHPLTVSAPLRDSRGRRNPRMGRTGYTI